MASALLIKYTSLALLTAHNTATVLLMSYSRVKKENGDKLYLTSVTVLLVEICKLLICITLVVHTNKWRLKSAGQEFYREIFCKPLKTLSVGVPAILYAIQNNLIFIAVSHLDAATYQVTYQLRLLTTALLSVLFLKRKLSCLQWLSLALLFIGVSVVQVSTANSSNKIKAVNETNSTQLMTEGTTVASTADSSVHSDYIIGMASVLVACCLSGFASVYFEKVLKSTDASIWLKNVQLAALSIPCALVGILISDWNAVIHWNIFFGFNIIVAVVILMQSVGGLLIAVVTKYADSIMKGYALSAAVVLTVGISALLFSTIITITCVIGSVFVIIAIYLFSAYPPPKKDNEAVTHQKDNLIALKILPPILSVEDVTNVTYKKDDDDEDGIVNSDVVIHIDRDQNVDVSEGEGDCVVDETKLMISPSGSRAVSRSSSRLSNKDNNNTT